MGQRERDAGDTQVRQPAASGLPTFSPRLGQLPDRSEPRSAEELAGREDPALCLGFQSHQLKTRDGRGGDRRGHPTPERSPAEAAFSKLQRGSRRAGMRRGLRSLGVLPAQRTCSLGPGARPEACGGTRSRQFSLKHREASGTRLSVSSKKTHGAAKEAAAKPAHSVPRPGPEPPAGPHRG